MTLSVENVRRATTSRDLNEEVVSLAAQICSIANSATSDTRFLAELAQQIPNWEAQAFAATEDDDGFNDGVQRFLCHTSVRCASRGGSFEGAK